MVTHYRELAVTLAQHFDDLNQGGLLGFGAGVGGFPRKRIQSADVTHVKAAMVVALCPVSDRIVGQIGAIGKLLEIVEGTIEMDQNMVPEMRPTVTLWGWVFMPMPNIIERHLAACGCGGAMNHYALNFAHR